MTINLEDFYSDKAKVKFACAKEAMKLSEEKPSALYPEFDFFVSLLDSDNQILLWTAIRIIGNLSAVDGKQHIDKLIPRLIKFLNTGKMITAANTIQALTVIAQNRPEYRDKILKAILKVERYTYDTFECRNVAIGHVLKSLVLFKFEIKNKKTIVDFIQRQTQNPRPATRKKAEALLKALSGKREK